MMSTEVHISKPGEPEDVLEERRVELPQCGDNEVVIRMLAAPINPSDINTVQGTYPLQPESGVPGHEGVGEVVSTGSCVSKLREGDRVVPLTSGMGTWRSRLVADARNWHAIPQDLSFEDAATLLVNPGTALSMLTQFVELQPGDVVTQNGGNSSVGRYVIALAKRSGWRTVSMVRDRDGWDEEADALKALGADVVARPDAVRSAAKDAGLPPPRLALDCVGGESAATLAKMLAEGGTLVCYGAMSRTPLQIAAPLLIFKDIVIRGFWMAGGAAKRAPPEARGELMDRLVGLIKDGVIHAECESWPLSDWRGAIAAACRQERRRSKVLLRMPE